MASLWSDDAVVASPLNKFVNRQQVLKVGESGFLVIASLCGDHPLNVVITSYDRQIESLKFWGDTAIVAGSETAPWSEKCRMLAKPNTSASPASLHRHMDETERALAGSCSARQPSAATLSGNEPSLTSLLPSPSVHPRSTAAPRRSPAHRKSPAPDARPRAAPRTATPRVPCSFRRTNPYSFPNPRPAWP